MVNVDNHRIKYVVEIFHAFKTKYTLKKVYFVNYSKNVCSIDNAHMNWKYKFV